MLSVNGIHVYYDAIHALKGVTFSVEAGELVTLLGGNGAGKTTTLKTISGLLRPRQRIKPRVGDARPVEPARASGAVFFRDRPELLRVVDDPLILPLRAGDADRLVPPSGWGRAFGRRHDGLPADDLSGWSSGPSGR